MTGRTTGRRRDDAGRRPWRLLAAGAALVVLTATSGCGQDRIDAYCSDLGTHRKQIADMLDSASPDALFSRRDLLHELGKKSPPDLQDEWQTFNGAIDDLEAALKNAKVKPSQISAGKRPADVSVADWKAIVDAADGLGGDDVVAAATGIEQEARDVCKINLGL